MSEINDPNSIKELALRSGKWALLARFSQVLGGGVLLILLPYWLTPDEYGVITMFSSVLALGLLVQQAGFAEATIRGADDAIRNTAFWLNFAVSVLLYLVLFLLSPLIAAFFHDSRLIALLRVGGLQIILAGLSNVPLAWLQKQFQFQIFSFTQLAGAITMIMVSLLMATLGYQYWSYVGGILAGALVRLAIVFIFFGWRPWTTFRWIHTAFVLKFGAFVLLEMLLGWLLIWFDNVVVARHLGSAAAGIYALAFNIAMLAVSLPCSAITGLTLPTFSRLQDNLDELRSAYLRGTGLIAAYAIPAGIGLYAIGGWIIRIVYPAQWESLGQVLSILGVYAGFGHLWILNTDVFRAIGKPQVMVKIYIFSVVVMLPIYWWTSQIGLLEFSIARSMIVVISAIPHSYSVINYLKLRKNYLWMLIRSPVIASAVMAVCLWFGKSFFHSLMLERGTGPLVVIGLVLFGAGAYLATLWFLERDFLWNSYQLLLRSVIRPRTL